MNGSAMRWLIRDVFRKARTSGLHAFLLTTTALVVGVCLTANQSIEGVTLLFGAWTISGDDAVRQLYFWLAFCVADLLGVLAVLLGTAGFLPNFLDSSALSVLIAKPLTRVGLLAGQVLGVTAFVGFHGLVFVVATAAAIGLRTGVWLPGYFLAWPLLLVHFLAFYGLSALVAVATRSTTAAMLASLLYCVTSWGMSMGRHLLRGIQLEETSQSFGHAVEAGYWILPKPTDFSLILHNALGVSPDGLSAVGLAKVQEMGQYHPTAAVLTSLAAGLVFLGMAAYEFQHVDY